MKRDTSPRTTTTTPANGVTPTGAPSVSSGSPTTTRSLSTSKPEPDQNAYVSLFSGIGGLDLGLDRAGWVCAAQVEKDPYRRRVLRRRWPEVARHDDVRTFPRWWRDGPAVRRTAMVAGGFPCQPHSHSGLKLGVGDERWGWPWFIAAVDAVRDANGGAWPIVLVENVRGLLRDADAFGWILGDLSDRGFDAEWSLVSACSVGAPHMRRRLLLVAHPAGLGWAGGGMAESVEAAGREKPAGGHRWDSDAGVVRVANGIPERMERVSALGDAVVPAVGELVGRAILRARTLSIDTLDTYRVSGNLDA